MGHLYEDGLTALTWILEQDDNWVRVESSCRHLQLLNTEFHNRKSSTADERSFIVVKLPWNDLHALLSLFYKDRKVYHHVHVPCVYPSCMYVYMFLVCPQNKFTKFKILIQGCVQSVHTNWTIITRNGKWQEIKTRKAISMKSRILAKERKRPKKLQRKVMFKNSKLILMKRHTIMPVTVKMKARFGEKERLFQKRSPEMKNFRNILNCFYN